MKSVLLCLLTPLLTFSFGVSCNNLLSQFITAPAPIALAEPAPRVFADVPAPAGAPADVSLPLPEPILIFEEATKVHGTHAGFFILGPKPKQFADLDFIEITLSDHGASSFISVYENSGNRFEEFQARFAFVSNKKLFIVTSKGTESGADSGFEYRFDGEFVRTDFEKIAGKQKAALRGTLTKTKEGRTIAESLVSFRMDYLGC